MNDSRLIRVLIADDHPVVWAGIKTMLEKEPDLRIVGEVREGTQVESLTHGKSGGAGINDEGWSDTEYNGSVKGCQKWPPEV